MKVDEKTFIKNGIVYFQRIWTCHGETWEYMFAWDDLNGAAWCPVCNVCGGFDGALFI